MPCPNCKAATERHRQSRLVTRSDCPNRCNTTPTLTGAIAALLAGEEP
jgi:hypothetical protein